MIQWILTIIIIAATLTYAFYLIIRRFAKKVEKQPEQCNGCVSDCRGCPVSDVKEYDIY
jgi:hypothetical protein